MATTWRQDSFRFRYDNGSETTAGWIAANNTNISVDVPKAGYKFRIRIASSEYGTTAATLTGRLRYSYKGGAYTQIPTVATSACVYALDSANLTDDAATTQQLSTGTFVAGKVDDVTAQCTATGSIAQNSVTDHEFMLCINFPFVRTGDTIDFRLYATTTAFTTYTNTGRVTITRVADANEILTFADDCFCDNGLNFYSTNASHLIGNGGNPYRDWIPFVVAITKGWTITSALIKLVAATTLSGTTCKIKVGCEAADNPATPTDRADLAGRSFSTAFTQDDNVASWTIGTTYQFDITTAVQEIINRAGWASGNVLAVMILDNGSSNPAYRDCCSFENTTYNLPILYVTATAPAGGVPAQFMFYSSMRRG
jgi:hypothetical protein